MCCWHAHGHLHHGRFGYGPDYEYGPPCPPYARRGRRSRARDLEDLEVELVRRGLQELREHSAKARQAPGAPPGCHPVVRRCGGPACAGRESVLPPAAAAVLTAEWARCPRRARLHLVWGAASLRWGTGDHRRPGLGCCAAGHPRHLAAPGLSTLTAGQRRALAGVPGLDALSKATGRLASTAALTGQDPQ